MADKVQERLESFVPALIDLQTKKLFSKKEIRQIVRKRREFEYRLVGHGRSKQLYLEYIQYEIAFEALRNHRCAAKGWKRQSVLSSSSLSHILNLFSRCVHIWPQDKSLWYQYIDFCLRGGSTKRLLRVVLEGLGYHPYEASFWLLAIDRELQLGYLEAPRRLFQLGLRCLPMEIRLWIEYFKFEVNCILKLIAAQDSLLLEKFPNGHNNTSVKDQDPKIGTDHLMIIVKTALDRLRGCSKKLAIFFPSSLEILSLLFNSPNQSRIQGLAELSMLISKAMLDTQNDIPLVVFFLWKLRLLSLVGEQKKLDTEQILTLLLVSMKNVWSVQNRSTSEVNGVSDQSKTDPMIKKRRKRIEQLKQSLIPQTSIQDEIQTNLLLSFLLLISNITKVAVKRHSSSDFILDDKGNDDSHDVYQNPSNSCLRGQILDNSDSPSLMAAIFSHYPTYLQFLKDHYFLAASCFVIPSSKNPLFSTCPNLSEKTISVLFQEHQIIWQALNITEKDNDDNDFCLSVHGTNSLGLPDDYCKRKHICKWIVNNVTNECLNNSIGIISLIIITIEELLPEDWIEREQMLSQIHEKVRNISPEVVQNWNINSQLEYHILSSKLSSQISEDVLFLLKYSREKSHPIKLPILLNVITQHRNVLERRMEAFNSRYEIEKVASNKRQLSPIRNHAKKRKTCDKIQESDSNLPSVPVTLRRNVEVLSTSEVQRLHQQSISLYDLLYGACHKEHLVELVQQVFVSITPMIDSLCGNCTKSEADGSANKMTSFDLLEWSRIMRNCFGFHLLPVERELIRRTFSVLLTIRYLGRVTTLLREMEKNVDWTKINRVMNQITHIWRTLIHQSMIFSQSLAIATDPSLSSLIPDSLNLDNLILQYISIASLIEQSIRLSEKHSPLVNSNMSIVDDVVASLSVYLKSNLKLSRLISLQLAKYRESCIDDPLILQQSIHLVESKLKQVFTV